MLTVLCRNWAGFRDNRRRAGISWGSQTRSSARHWVWIHITSRWCGNALWYFLFICKGLHCPLNQMRWKKMFCLCAMCQLCAMLIPVWKLLWIWACNNMISFWSRVNMTIWRSPLSIKKYSRNVLALLAKLIASQSTAVRLCVVAMMLNIETCNSAWRSFPQNSCPLDIHPRHFTRHPGTFPPRDSLPFRHSPWQFSQDISSQFMFLLAGLGWSLFSCGLK